MSLLHRVIKPRSGEESEQRIESRTHVPPVTGRNTSDSEATKSRPIVIIGDSVIKHIDPKKLSQRPVRKFSYPGKTTDEIAEAVTSSVTSIDLASDPSHVIIHAGTKNLPMDSAQSCAAKIKSLALKVKNKFPNSRIGISGITYREDIQVDSKRNEINETVRLMAEDNNITYIDNSVIDNSGLNGSRLHLNAKGSSLLAVQFIKFLRSGSGKHTQTRKGFQISTIQQLGKLLMELGGFHTPAHNRKRPH